MAHRHRELEILKSHKAWCDRYAVFSVVVVILIFGGMTALLEFMSIPAPDRVWVYVFLATIVLTIVLWNAVGLAVARIHELIELSADRQLDLPEQRTPRSPPI